MKVRLATTKTEIIGDGKLAPQSAIFSIRNTTGNYMIINDCLRIYVDNTFSLNLQALVGAMQSKGYRVINKTQYNIRFNDPQPYQGAMSSATLIETFVKTEQ